MLQSYTIIYKYSSTTILTSNFLILEKYNSNANKRIIDVDIIGIKCFLLLF